MHALLALGGFSLIALLFVRRRGSSAGYASGQSSTQFGSAIAQATAMSYMIQQANNLGALQRAGQFGVSSVAPAIDSAGQPKATKLLTQQAWIKNGTLHTASIIDESWARRIVFDMLHLYWQAIADGQKAERLQAPQAPAASPVVSPAAASPQLLVAAKALLTAIQATVAAGKPVFWTREHGQGEQMWRPTYNFQRAYNASGHGHLVVDGVYGGATDNVLASLLGDPVVRQAEGPEVASPYVAGW